VLNRVMIDPQFIGMPASIASGCLAMYYVAAVARVGLGHLTDTRRLFGYQRTGYVWIGTVASAIALLVAGRAIWWAGESPSWLPVIVLALLFAVYGVFAYLASVAMGALLYDLSTPANRSQLMGVTWSMLMVGTIIGAGLGGVALRSVTPATAQEDVTWFLASALTVVVVLTVAGTAGVERRYPQMTPGRAPGDDIGLRTALRTFFSSRAAMRFFAFVFLLSVGAFMQQAVLEPGAGEVFGMTLAQSTQLNAFWGLGTLSGLLLTGFLLVPRLGKQGTVAAGILLATAAFAALTAATLMRQPLVFRVALTAIGVGCGIALNGALGLMLDVTDPANAGLYLGTFGLGQYAAQGLTIAAGGALLDLGRARFADPAAAYALVFGCEAAILLWSLRLVYRLDVGEHASRDARLPSDIMADAVK
jgi:BCD family chlorophyll transporter-like MFS transporter